MPQPPLCACSHRRTGGGRRPRRYRPRCAFWIGSSRRDQSPRTRSGAGGSCASRVVARVARRAFRRCRASRHRVFKSLRLAARRRQIPSHPSPREYSVLALATTLDAIGHSFVPGQSNSATAAPGIVHQPCSVCSALICEISPGLCPVNKSICSALPGKPRASNAVQNRGTSLSERTRSRLCVGLRSTPWHGFVLISASSSLIAHVKMALALAST